MAPQRHHFTTLLLLFSVTAVQSLSPENHLFLPSSRKFGQDDTLFCQSWWFSVETNDAGEWSTIPTRCFNFVKNYITGDRYVSDSKVVADDELEFAKSVNVTGDGKDAWVFDVDETLLFNLPYYETHGYGSEIFDDKSFDEYMLLAKSPALTASLGLYKELQQLGFTIFILTGRSEPYRKATEANLRDSGYSNWERLILRGPSDKGKLAVEYKSEKRKELVDEGYRIRGNTGDQWSDLVGYATAQSLHGSLLTGAYMPRIKASMNAHFYEVTPRQVYTIYPHGGLFLVLSMNLFLPFLTVQSTLLLLAEESELQCVPGRFDSVEDYISVFEPLLFEECRAQLYSTWEELSETSSREAHMMARVKSVERRERGWYDVVVLPANETKWTFKEGDVAVIFTPRPGSVRARRNSVLSAEDYDEPEGSARTVGTIRRHIPLDVRDPPGAILHFYVGDTYDPNSTSDSDHVLKKLQPRSIWLLSVLGTLATSQREYVALHAFRRLNVQMQNAILKPSAEQFPKYEEQTPAIPDCFTPNFVEHLHRTFNGPQLSAIQWAAMHTAAGTSNGVTKRQEPWPFTLVQGPPGTGKTHTVWGMLNVIHLVQYQHYYTALLKKLAPESYKQNNDRNADTSSLGSIDEVLRSMDENLFRTLPKLCPKPRMLVCAPSNAATDELLARVLDRGFIDGEMKVYRPDVARVGVDAQSRAAQAVSVERRTEQLLVKTREEIFGWLQQLRGREAHLSRQMTTLQVQLNSAAAAGRSQGSVGVDPDVLMARDQNRDGLLQNLAAVVEERDKVLVEMSRLLILEGKFRSGSSFNLEEARASLETSFANEAEVVFTTLSSSGRKLFSRLTHGFDMVVIDEAAQASEMGILPPLALGAARCVLVGDPQQLPATVISKAAGTLLYSRSLFERFQLAGCPTMLLSVQYRMHPQIRDFPSRYFYQGRLTDSESVASLPDEKYYQDPLLKPYVFFDITHGRESHRGGSVSYQNIHEAQFCLRLYEHLHKTAKSLGLGKVTMGIITPYKLQLKCLQREFEDVLNSEEGRDLYINTVDAFQGQERDVIIMSCVRASNHGVGFVADIRRMNVALTRARRALWVMGNANALMQSDDWAALITDAKARKCYMDMDSLPKEFLITKGPPHNSFPGKFSSGSRGLRPGGPRSRLYDVHADSKPGPVLDEEKPKHVSNRED